jgi:hypothetical protein
MTFHHLLALQIATGFASGLAVGFLHFATLRLNVALFASGAAGRAVALQAVRLAATVFVLAALSRLGPWATVCAGAGLLCARHTALRLAQGPS